MCDILEQQTVPSVEVLVSSALNPFILNHISHRNTKYVQNHDKEMAVIHHSMLYATGPLCTVNDHLEQNIAISQTDLKLVAKQILSLLGSENNQLSALRRKKVLTPIKKSKAELANRPIPNAKKWLFSDDFQSMASNEAEISQG